MAGSRGEQPPFGLKPKTLPDGVQDTGEILLVDTGKLPAKLERHTVRPRVG
ncbi:hypothetical protein [Nocardia sp. NPDC051463]|uniref:hypothetical protein n=1 Tax=Nocardia sp. NPDC051463 TaxID=3154845 RepID=UPI00344E0ED2